MLHIDRLDLRLAGMSPAEAAAFARALRSELARLVPDLPSGAGAGRIAGLAGAEIRLAPGESPRMAARRAAARIGATLAEAARPAGPQDREARR